ncbi:MAG: S41 family peptidase [Phycisphaerales bacterium]
MTQSRHYRPRHATPLLFTLALAALAGTAAAQPRGYYTAPTLAEDAIIFSAEGDLWRVGMNGGPATRLTTHPGLETNAVVSPDNATIAFSAQYEGPQEVYTMPTAGGSVTRRTFSGFNPRPVAFAPSGELLYATRTRSGNWQTQLVSLNLNDFTSTLIPLNEAASASFDTSGNLYFTKPDFQGSHTRRYKGGTARHAWSFPLTAARDGATPEATELTADYAGESVKPMWWNGRIYFMSDRPAEDAASGVMNIWSSTPDGKDLKRHTGHADYEVRGASLRNGKVVYQLGADLWLLDLANGNDQKLDITLAGDMDQTRERWIDKPWDFVTAAHVSKDGEQVALTSRGQVFVAPRKFGRFVQAAGAPGVRFRDARFMPDGSVLAMSDRTGETELWTLPANGLADATQLTSDADALRVQAVPSPDGKRIAHHDKRQRLFIWDSASRQNIKIDDNPFDVFFGLTWSSDSRFLAYVTYADNQNPVVKVYSTVDNQIHSITTDRAASYSPAWSADGKWIYFLSERNLQNAVSSPWGLMQPEPFFDKLVKVYAVSLTPGLRSPFLEPDEIETARAKAEADKKKEEQKKEEEKKKQETAADKTADKSADKATDKTDDKAQDAKPDATKPEDKKDEAKPVEIDWAGLEARLYEVPVPPGNYNGLEANDKALFFTDTPFGADKPSLKALAIGEDALKKREFKIETVADGIDGWELSGDGKSILIRQDRTLAVIDAAPARADDLAKAAVRLDNWKFAVQPREEWRQMFNESWRLLRDFFYDRNMHGVDWQAIRAKYAPLVDRVAGREDLADIMAQMSAELSALHHFVIAGDVRSGKENLANGSLGADLSRDIAAGGYRIDRVFSFDADRPEKRSPLARQDLDIKQGDVIEKVNGVPALSVSDIASLLRNTAGRQVLLHVKRPGDADARQVIVKPIGPAEERDLRYHQWIEERRALVDKWSDGQVGYVYLAAMGKDDFSDFARQYFPVFNRKALIIDVRSNGGGNIDPWILERLMRKPWMFWSGPVGKPTWGMQYSFRGPIAAICDEWTASDGEAFTEGFKRLGIGKVFGTRTWGGEIWLSFSNNVVDNGIASCGETGVFGADGTWLIEGRGVVPDVEVKNPPAATFRGEDAQLKATVDHLLDELRKKPVPDLVVPAKPDKSR